MDYTKLPRRFIYIDRKDIDDFPVCSQCDFMSLEETFLEALEQRPFINESYDAPELILKIFNNARYITTLICMENHPHLYLRRYLEKAGSNDSNIIISNHAMPATMALVKNYLCHYMPTYNYDKIVEAITKNFSTNAWKKHTSGGQDDFNKLVIDYTENNHPIWVNDPNFEPRDIREVVTDSLVTARDISENIDYILASLEKNVAIVDEEIAPLNAMYKKVKAWFPSDLDDNLHKELALDKIGTRLKKLDPNDAYALFNLTNEIEKNLYIGSPISSKTKEEINKYMKKTLGVDMDGIASVVSPTDQTDAEKEELKACATETELKDSRQQAQTIIDEQKAQIEKLKADNALIPQLQQKVAELEKQLSEKQSEEETIEIPRQKIRIEMLNTLFAKLGCDTEWMTKNRKASALARAYAAIMGHKNPKALVPDVGKVVYNVRPPELDGEIDKVNKLLQDINNDWKIEL